MARHPSPTPAHVELRAGPVDFGFRDLVGAARRNLRFMAAISAAVAALVFLAIVTQPPVYTATATIVVDSTARPTLGERTEIYVPPTEDSLIVESEVGVIGSRSMIARVVDALKLEQDPRFNPSLKKRGLFGAPAQTSRARLNSAIVESVARSLKVRRVGRTRLVDIEFAARSPETASAVANAFAEQYMASEHERLAAENERSIDWLRTRLGALRTELSVAEQASVDYRRENGLLAASGATLVERQLIELQNQLVSQRGDLAERMAQAQEAARAGSNIDTLPAVMGSETITDLRRQEAEVLRRVSELRRTYGPDWQDLRRAETELVNVRDALRSELARINATLSRQVIVSRLRVRQTEDAVNDLRSRLSNGNTAEIKLRELDRTADAARLLYESALARLRLDEIRQSNLEPNVRVISRAIPPASKSSPKGALALILAMACAAVAAAAAAALRELMDRGVRSPEAIERATGMETLSLLPRPPTQPRPIGVWPRHDVEDPGQLIKALDYAIAHPRSQFAQSFDRLLARLTLTSPKGCKVILVTSPTTRDGKTLAAFGLARAAAAAGKRTLIIDCDPSRNGLTSNLQLDAPSGIVQVLRHEASMTGVMGQDDLTSLRILPWSRTSPDSGSALLEQFSFFRFLGSLRNAFDIIVLEGAPVMEPAAMHAARCADGVVLAARWRETSEGQLLAALDVLDGAGAKVLGAALTHADVNDLRFFSDSDPAVLLADHATAAD